MKETGVVSLIGAGPGDPDLITKKGIKRLKTCDAVVYDSLASDLLLEQVPSHCRKIYAGKRAGVHSMKQEEINQLLIQLAMEGLLVVRLKGGDPFVFGRGGEEVQALKNAGIPYEVVSGVTSAVAALASAGIPITHRAVSRSFHVMTGHTLAKDGVLPPDFETFARLSGTLVFLMGLGTLPLIVKGLIEQGKLKETPAAVISNGTLPDQKIVRGMLSNIQKETLKAGIVSPAIIVVGAVAALDFSSTHMDPLTGCQIGITGTGHFVRTLREQLEECGAAVKCLFTLSFQSYRSLAAMKTAYGNLSKYSWIVLTSANGVREFFHGLLECGYDFRSLGGVKFAVIGTGTEKQLYHYGFRADYVPDHYQVKDLAKGLCDRITKKDYLLIPRSSGGSIELNETLDQKGIPYDDIILYDVNPEAKVSGENRKDLSKLDYVTFASASGVEAFFSQGEDSRMKLSNVKVVCIGAITANALKRHGREADIIASESSISGMVDAICLDFNRERN
ncbi:uroporphyrinogen-III C-methyltransferase [Clostridium sp. E02]|uniref:uroporphyrinogen-III C-methyltransferase n=1 Tax=Clostridium sp. E02 TaxID=2487134 RepID=UPI000F53087F|nr:uroporphyrinogen-III C-methyltransferase [Clostridium sp. E02]